MRVGKGRRSKVVGFRKSEPELAREVAVLRLAGDDLVEEVLEHFSLTVTERKSISDSSDGVSEGERERKWREADVRIG